MQPPGTRHCASCSMVRPLAIAKPADTTLAALNTAQSLSAAKYHPSNGASYPDDDLGGSLSNVAQLVKANVGLRVAAVDCGNWDMHVGLGRPSAGWMHDNLTALGKALAAFATDLGTPMSRVVVVTLSEFGRRVRENDSGRTRPRPRQRGLRHGWRDATVGRSTAAGRGSPASDLVLGNLKGATDYRTILAELLEQYGSCCTAEQRHCWSPKSNPRCVGNHRGKITNKSGTPLPIDLKVVLHVFQHDAVSDQFSELDSKETMSDANGNYSFAGLAMPTNYAFYISVDYGNTTYSSEPITPTADVMTYDLPLDVSDTTTDTSVLTAARVRIILDYSKPDVHSGCGAVCYQQRQSKNGHPGQQRSSAGDGQPAQGICQLAVSGRRSGDALHPDGGWFWRYVAHPAKQRSIPDYFCL